MSQTIDHLVYAVPDLEDGVNEVERLLGVRAAPGGKHTGRGTHNALLSLGLGVYLEIIGPDPDQPDPDQPRAFGIDTLHEPRLVTWPVRVHDIEVRAEASRNAGYDPGIVLPMSRTQPDRTTLRWKLTWREHMPGDGLIPFLIQWETADHPSRTSPAGCSLLDLEAEHPHLEAIQPMLDALGVDLQVSEGGRPALLATIECARGTVVLS
jgi:hypothetical protein